MANASLASAVLAGMSAMPEDILASVNCIAMSRASDKASEHGDHEHERNEHQRSGPRLPMPIVVRADRVREDLQGKRCNWFREVRRPELIPEGRKQERRSFSCDASNGDEHTSDDASHGRAK